MQNSVKEALYELFGDKDAAEEFIASVDQINLDIVDKGLITRAVDEETVTETETETVPEADEETDVEISEEVIEMIVGRAVERVIARLAEAVPAEEPQPDPVMASLPDVLADISQRLAALEQPVEEMRRQWAEDLPSRSRKTIVYRPRQEQQADESEASLDSIASASLSALPVRK